MKGYVVDSGYMGYIPSEGKYQLFETDDEHAEYIRESEES